MTAVALRPATPADSEFCFQLHQAAMGDYITATWGWDEQVQRDFHSREFDPGRWQIITAGGADIGVLEVEHRPSETFLSLPHRNSPRSSGPRHRHRLISALIDEAGQRGQDLVLEVLTVNLRAQALYQRLGMKEIARHGDSKITMRSARPHRPELGQLSAHSRRQEPRGRPGWQCTGAFEVRLARMVTIVAFHAHPDDEVLLTGGTIAWLAAEGHRVIIVVACSGEMWPDQHRGRRLEELRASAAILGADKAVHLGYADSGTGPVLFDDPPGGTRFARADVEEAAGKLASLLADEHADLLLSYDPQGGYGQSDHVRVHQVGARAAELAGVRVVEATVPRELIARFARLLLLLRLVTRHRLDEMRGYGMPQAAITHRVDVRRYAAQKRAALAAHRTDVFSRGRTARLFRVLIRSPLPVFRIACGTEWFVEPGGRTGELVARGQTTRA